MKRIVFFIVFAIVLISLSAAQNTNSDVQRIVGAWTQSNDGEIPTYLGPFPVGTIWVFNADGTMSIGHTTSVRNYGISICGEIFISIFEIIFNI